MNHTKSVRLPPLPSLRAFEAVARLASVKDAAEEMRLTASAISHQLRNLENHLGVDLFKRRNQAIELTEAGALFATYAERAFRELRQGVAALKSDLNHGSLHVSAAPLFAMEFLIPALPEFERAHPHVQVQLDVGESLADFDSDTIDVAIRIGPRPPSILHSETLLEVCMGLVCSPRMLTGTTAIRSPNDLRSHALLTTDELHEEDGWERWRLAAGIADLKPANTMRFDTFLGTVQAAEAGLGFVLAPLPILSRHLAERRLVAPFEISIPSPWPYRFVCRRTQVHNPKIQLFRRWLTDRCTAHAKLALLPCKNRSTPLYSAQDAALIA